MRFTQLMSVFFFLVLSCGIVSALVNPIISVDPQIYSIPSAGEEFIVNITVDSGSYEVYGFQYTLYYDSSILEVVSQDQGTFLNNDGTSTYIINRINEPGKIEYAQTRLNVQTGVTGSGLAVAIKFKCKVDDTSTTLNLDDVIKVTYVEGNSLESLVPDAVDGSVIIGGSSDDGVDACILRALDYLRGQQTTNGGIGDSEWTVMAITAAGEDPYNWRKSSSSDSIVDYLKTTGNNLELATDIEKYILAIVAAGENPTAFNSHNHLADLKNEFDGTQIGDVNLLNDDFWGIIALISAGVNSNEDIISDTLSHIKLNQQTDGGWGCYSGMGTDTDDTAAAIMALITAGEDPSSDTITKGFEFIKSNQNPDGGFGSGSFGTESNAGSTAWALNAIYAAGDDPTSFHWTVNDRNPIDFLLPLQRDDGGFDWKPDVAGIGFTEEVVVALLGKYYPVKVLEESSQHPMYSIYMRVEGQNNTIYADNLSFNTPVTHIDDWSGNEVIWDTPLVSAATEILDDLYDLDGNGVNEDEMYTKDKWGGYFIQMIAGEWNSGNVGWMYRVNYYSPEIGADEFILGDSAPPSAPHTEVLWYYGSWNELPIKISVDKINVSMGDMISVNVTYFNESVWLPLEGATVYADTDYLTVHADIDYLTDENGSVNILMKHPGSYEVFAEKQNYIRSKKINVEVEGIQDTAQVMLSATIVPAISFYVTEDALDFGRIGVGYNKTGTGLNITNTGSHDIYVTAEIGDNSSQLFKEGLYLSGIIWRDFSAVVPHDTSVWEYSMGPYSSELRVPMDYSEAGEQNGTLIFWAEIP